MRWVGIWASSTLARISHSLLVSVTKWLELQRAPVNRKPRCMDTLLTKIPDVLACKVHVPETPLGLSIPHNYGPIKRRFAWAFHIPPLFLPYKVYSHHGCVLSTHISCCLDNVMHSMHLQVGLDAHEMTPGVTSRMIGRFWNLFLSLTSQPRMTETLDQGFPF